LGLAARIMQRDQALTTEIELQANVINWPVARRAHRCRAMNRPLAVWPILMMGNRLALKGPAVDQDALPVAPVGELGCADLQTIKALGNRERHGGSYRKRSNGGRGERVV